MNAPSFLRVLLSLFLLIPTLSFAEHVDGAFAEHTLTEQRLWLRTGVWVSENGGIQLSLGQTKSYLGQQIYVSGSPSGRVEEADEVVVEFRRAGRDAAWQAVAKTNKWTGVWTPKGPGQYEFRVRARVFGEWITSNVATLEVVKSELVLTVSRTSVAVGDTVSVEAKLVPEVFTKDPVVFKVRTKGGDDEMEFGNGTGASFTPEKAGQYVVAAKAWVGTWGIESNKVEIEVHVLEAWLAKLKRVSKQALSAAVKGDLAEEENGVVGMLVTTAGGFIPIYGQLADIRDTAAALNQMRDDGWQKGGNWLNLGANIVGFIPGMDWGQECKQGDPEGGQGGDTDGRKEIIERDFDPSRSAIRKGRDETAEPQNQRHRESYAACT